MLIQIFFRYATRDDHVPVPLAEVNVVQMALPIKEVKFASVQGMAQRSVVHHFVISS